MNDLCFLCALHKMRTHSTHTLTFGGKIIACPAADWQATGGEELFINAFSFSCLFCFIFSSLNYNELTVKGKKKHLTSSTNALTGWCE